MTTTTISDFRANIRQYVDDVINRSFGFCYYQQGGTAVVLISIDEYNSIIETVTAHTLELIGTSRVEEYSIM